MVAPSRKPQARGVKCELCKKILALTKWLDQTVRAKSTTEAKTVLNLFDEHDKSGCQCIPKSIQNLLVGSTHFEIHRLLSDFVDAKVTKQAEKANSNNDTATRFKIYKDHNNEELAKKTKQHLFHLTEAISFWKTALEDRTDPFNSKLAIRLGLTHHAIFACYLFKFYRIHKQQLICANLVLNLFHTVEGVSSHAKLHANFLLIKTLLDMNQIQLARQYLDEVSGFDDSSHYESILMTTVLAETKLLDSGDTTGFDELAKLSVIQSGDKLQHYYARTLAIGVLIRYIHIYKNRTPYCFEFFHTYRFLGAMIRRHECLDRVSWVKFAICDLVFSLFDVSARFFMRAGQPECLDLLYNGLNLIAYKNGCFYWQYKLLEIGGCLDLLCDKYKESSAKVDAMSKIASLVEDSQLVDLMKIGVQVSSLAIRNRQEKLLKEDQPSKILKIISRIRANLNSLNEIHPIELYNSNTFDYRKTIRSLEPNDTFPLHGAEHSYLSFKLTHIAASIMIKSGSIRRAKDYITDLGAKIKCNGLMSYDDYSQLLEAMISCVDLEKSQEILIDSIANSKMFLRVDTCLESKFNKLTVVGDENKTIVDDTISLSLTEVLRELSSLPDETIILTYLREAEPNPDYQIYRRSQELLFSLRSKGGVASHEQLLFHFSESASSNTMRYRWMMFEEPQLALFDNTDATKTTKLSDHLKYTSFCNSTLDIDAVIKAMQDSISTDQRLVQIKYMVKGDEENTLVASYDRRSKPIYVHVRRSMSENGDTGLINELSSKLDEAKKTLAVTNQRTRSEKRQKLEKEIGVILYDIENELIGPFRFLLYPRTIESDYKSLVDSIMNDINAMLGQENCRSQAAVQLMISNAALLTRQEYCDALSTLYDCDTGSRLVKECFDKWIKCMEAFLTRRGSNLDKTTYLQRSHKGQLGLILDQGLENVPFESLPTVRILRHGIFRIPSLRLYKTITSSLNEKQPSIRLNSTFYILDPASNLTRTRERFESKLRSQKDWTGWIAKPPETDALEQYMSERDLYLYMGHGAGTIYYNPLRSGRGLNAMPRVQPTAIVMGCSSGRQLSEGPQLESFGINWVFVMRGSPAYLGLLWDVTDTDIDKFLDSLLIYLLGNQWGLSTITQKNSDDFQNLGSLSVAVAQARQACQLSILVGAAPVLYGLPVSCSR